MALLNIKLQLDGSQFRDEQGRIVAAVDQVEGKVEASFGSATAKVAGFSFAFNQISQLVSGVTDRIAEPLRKIAEFDTGLANVASLGVDNIRELRDGILDMSKTVAVPISDLTAGMYEVVSAGVDASNQIGFLNLTAQAAKAGVAQTTDAISLSAAIVKGYGLEWSETEGILDKAFQTVKLGQTNFQQLAGSMGGVVPLASALKVSTNELFGAYAALTGVTGNTSEVTTQLKAVFTGLAGPTDELIKLVMQHGHASVESMVATEGLAGLLKILQEATGGSAAKMGALFGSVEAVNALLALAGPQMQSFADKTQAMAESAGVMSEAFEVQSDTIESRWLKLQNQANARLFEMLDTVKPLISGVLDFASGLLQVNWEPFIVGAIAAGTALAGLGIANIIAGLGGLVPALAAAGTAISGFAATATVAISSIPLVGWIAAGVSALAGLTAALIVAADDEKDLAEERKRTAQETINIIEAEKRRIEQAEKTNGITRETTQQLKLLNEEMIRQQKIVADANIIIFTRQLEEAKDELHDLHQGIIDMFDFTGSLTRQLFQRFGDDVIAQDEFVNKRLAEIGDFLFQNKLGYIKLSDDQIEALQDESKAYTEIREHLNRAATAQKNLNTEIENRKRLLEGGGSRPEVAPTPLTKSIAPKIDTEKLVQQAKVLKPEFPLAVRFTAWMPEISELKLIEQLKPLSLDFISETLQDNLQREDEMLRLQMESKIISEQEYFDLRVALLNDFQQRQAEVWGEESAEALRIAADKAKFEEDYHRKKKQLQEENVRQFLSLTSGLMANFQGVNEGLFAVGKGFSYAQAVVDTYAAANKALAAYPPPFSFIAAAAAVATGLANVAKINATKFERRAEGGFLGDGIRTVLGGEFGGGENRLIIANDGEFIINREATARNRELLELINATNAKIDLRNAPRLQNGGPVGATAGAPVIVGNDLTDVVEAIRNIRIEIKSDLDAIQFFRKNFPRFEREENLRRVQ